MPDRPQDPPTGATHTIEPVRVAPLTFPGSIDESIRNIVRDEFMRIAEEITRPRPRREWVSMSELAEHLGVSPPTVRAMLERGCPHIVPATQPRFKLEEVVQWAREQAHARRRDE